MTTTPTWLPKEYIVSFSWMVTHPGIKVIQQGLTLAIGQEVHGLSPFGASCTNF